VRKITDKTLDAHLMITSPARYAARFLDAGADIVVFHVEAETSENIFSAIESARKSGKKIGLAIKPNTPTDTLFPYIGALDMALIMTVEPGFGGQKFISATLPKISELRRVIESRGINCDIEVDGGINVETAKLCVEAGANILVAGNDVFSAPDRAARIAELRDSRRIAPR